ncbi:ABC transporter permease [Actinoplanes sp. L3-i22]|uniref:ABC transporter permease n=1 Tax=Actinoplanes sp. L3-i22 TaxID=2836373 RepID=UPI001C760EF7|nr:ABC transporter permease [Actinoplanes sp. L3-i22]BCY11156.1 hypothetical protein L3i22_062440 [Actinoplanes sp. L3-i22]
MLTVTLSGLRARWATLVGAFVALGLGVALCATMGLTLAATLHAPGQRPERLAGAPVVVRGADELRVPTRHGERVQPLARPGAVPPGLVAELARIGPVIADRSFPVTTADPAGHPSPVTDGSSPAKAADPAGHPSPVTDGSSPAKADDPVAGSSFPADAGDLVGHSWSVAALGDRRLVAGRAPRGPAEIVLAADPAQVGRVLPVRTPAGQRDYTVSGVLAPVAYERAVFFADDAAAAIAPRIDNLAVWATPDAVRAVAGGSPGVRVLTGDDRRRADPEPDRDRDALVAMNALVGTAGGVAVFVSVFVVASTFAFAVAQRRREIGLLRTAGATPRQVRATLLAEAVVVGVLASAAGCTLGARGAPWLARLLVGEGLAPAWFTIGDQHWPYHVAFWTGLAVALAGAVAATVRAGRVRPVEGLREAAVDATARTPGRWLLGGGLLAGGLGLLAWRLLTDPGEALHRKTYTTQPMLLIIAAALLAPIVIGPLTRLVAGWPGAVGLLVRANARAGSRRAAAVAAPVLVTVALGGSLLGTTATIQAGKAAEARAQTVADLIVDGSGIDERTTAAIRDVPGAQVMTSSATAVYTVEEGVALTRSPAEAVDPGTLGAVRRLPVTAGRLEDLDDGGIVVTEEWAEHTVGRTVRVWLGDGTPRSLRIVAVLATGTGSNGAYVTRHNAGGSVPNGLSISWRPGADRVAGAAAVRALTEPTGARVRTRDQWLADHAPTGSRQTRAGYLVVLGIALTYTGIAVANTMLMAMSDRSRELAVLRLAGATRRQVVLLVAAEATTLVLAGSILGVIVAGTSLLGIWGALTVLSVPATIILPWATLGLTVAACTAVAVTAAVLPTLGLVRR